MQEQGPIGERGGQVQVVKHGDDRQGPGPPQACEHPQQRDLVPQVEVQGRLVEEEERRLLGEGEGHEHSLALTPGELVDRTLHETVGIGVAQGVGHRVGVPVRRTEQGGGVRDAPEGDDLGHGQPGRQLGELGQDGDASRDLEPGPVALRSTQDEDLSPVGARVPASTRSSVVLPLPFAPRTATSSPAPTARSAPSSTGRVARPRW